MNEPKTRADFRIPLSARGLQALYSIAAKTDFMRVVGQGWRKDGIETVLQLEAKLLEIDDQLRRLVYADASDPDLEGYWELPEA